MTELKFHRQIYSGKAIDEAVKVFSRFAHFEMAEEAENWVVRVTTASGNRERKVAHELANYALGLTIKNQEVKKP